MNLITSLTQSVPVLAGGYAIHLLKDVTFTLNTHREMAPIYTLGEISPSSFNRGRRSLSGNIHIPKKELDKTLKCINETNRIAIEYNDAILLLEEITITGLSIESNNYTLDYQADGVQHLQREKPIYVHTLTRSHEI